MNRTQKYGTATMHANKYSSKSARNEGKRLFSLQTYRPYSFSSRHILWQLQHCRAYRVYSAVWDRMTHLTISVQFMEIDQQNCASNNYQQTFCYLFSERRFKEAWERNKNTVKNRSDCHIKEIQATTPAASARAANDPGTGNDLLDHKWSRDKVLS